MENRRVRWHVVDIRAIWVREFAAALASQADTLGWLPEIRNFAPVPTLAGVESISDPAIQAQHFSIQRGFARKPLRWVLPIGRGLASLIRRAGSGPDDVLVCSAPHYAALAERWRGRFVYYLSDFMYAWGDDPAYILALDRRTCRRADYVFPDSKRIAQYLVDKAGCDPAKITVSPMATRATNLPPAPLMQPEPLPADVADLPRPVAGVIGNMGINVNWILLEDAIRRTPWLSWVFIGPTDLPMPEEDQGAARERVIALGGRVRFVGFKPYGQLQAYARCFDVAVMPYRKREPNYSGSATRFYEHLAACRPILSTDGVAELLEKEPLLKVAATADAFVEALDELRARDFRDGEERRRWERSRHDTWEARARQLIDTVDARASVESKPSQLAPQH
jgi:glycosyltransferase involved in cell wall biosynthesis